MSVCRVAYAAHSMGIFYFACSFAPGMLKRMLELIGFVADRDLGLQYFRQVYDNAGLRGAVTFHFHLSFSSHAPTMQHR